MENIAVSNITMEHASLSHLYYHRLPQPWTEEHTDVSYGGNISINNVIADDGFTGWNHRDRYTAVPLRNISLSNIYIQYRGGGSAELSKRLSRNKARIIWNHVGWSYTFCGMYASTLTDWLHRT